MEAASVAVRRKQKRPSGFSEGRLGAAMVAPSLVVMALVAAFPIGYAVWLSLNEYSVRVEGLSRFVGFDNYADELWGENSSEFWDAFLNTFIFTGFSVSIELVLGTAFALAMHQAFRGRAIFEPNLGFWSSMLSALGLPGADALWYGEDGCAMATLIFADVWKTAPFMALLILAGLQVIPEDVYDAAKVDGATA